MGKQLFFFRPGEEARMLAKCQFGIDADGKCGATLTYPIQGYPWRRNVMKHYAFHLSEEETALLFAEVRRLKAEHPTECLSNDQLWSDSSEKANGITRNRSTGTLCHTIGISGGDGQSEEQFAMREDSDALLTSALYRTISRLIGPHEKLDRVETLEGLHQGLADVEAGRTTPAREVFNRLRRKLGLPR